MPEESWRDAVARIGNYVGVAHDLLTHYDELVAKGLTPENAAAQAAHSFSLVAYAPDGE